MDETYEIKLKDETIIIGNYFEKNNIIFIKLENGYVFGIKKEKIEKITKIKKEKINDIKKKINGIDKKINDIEEKNKKINDLNEEINNIDKKINDIEEKNKKINDLNEDKKIKDSICILSCGGTIASKIDYETGGVSPVKTKDELLTLFFKEDMKIYVKQVYDLLSEQMTPFHYVGLAKEIEKMIEKGAKGIVIAHGTDTMHYTASMISFMIQNPKIPIVFTGSQRSSDRGSSDNHMNLLCSIKIAESNYNCVGICMHETTNDLSCIFINAVNARKMHSSKRDAFKSINRKPIARIYYPSLEIQEIDFKKNNLEMKIDTNINENVCICYIYPGFKYEFFDNLKKYNGIVLVGTGFGHINSSNEMLEKIKELIKLNIPVVMSTQTIYGQINLNIYSAGRKIKQLGVIGNFCNFTPETAFTKLMWVLGHTNNLKQIKKEMETNICGENLNRLEI